MLQRETVSMYIDKFDKVVLIEKDHPLAIAQRAKGPGTTTSKKTIAKKTGTVSGKTVEELAEMTKPELVELAESLNIEVVNEKDDDKKPRIADYINALSQTAE